jgi:hypothetical protein
MTEPNFDRLACTITNKLCKIESDLAFALRFISKVENPDIRDNLDRMLRAVRTRCTQLLERIK